MPRSKSGAGLCRQVSKRPGPIDVDGDVTGIPCARLGTRKVFKRYHQRQREEFSFKDGKQSLSTAKMPTLKLSANRAHVKVVALAQTILQLFARRFLRHKGRYGPTCKTIREKVLTAGGKNQREPGDPTAPEVLRVSMGETHVPSGSGGAVHEHLGGR
jgi:hypothetical protein